MPDTVTKIVPLCTAGVTMRAAASSWPSLNQKMREDGLGPLGAGSTPYDEYSCIRAFVDGEVAVVMTMALLCIGETRQFLSSEYEAVFGLHSCLKGSH